MWHGNFELPDGSFSVSYIQDYSECYLLKGGIFNLQPEMMKLLGNTKSKITKDGNGENVPHLDITEVVLVHCNIVNNDYEHDLRVVYTFVPNRSFSQLLNISPKNFIFFYIFLFFIFYQKR